MRKVYRLIFTEYFIHLTFITATLFTVVAIFDILDFVDEFNLLTPLEVTKFLAYRIPYCLSYISMFSILLAAISSLTALSQRYELIAVYVAGVSSKKVALCFIFLITVSSLAMFFNNAYLAPLYYRKSLVLTKKQPELKELILEDLALKKGNSFLIIESIENFGKAVKKAVKINLQPNGKVDTIYLIPEAVKTVDGWQTNRAYKFNDKAEREDFEGTVDLNISESAINLAIKPSLLPLNELIKIIDFGHSFNINVSKYSHAISRKLLSIFSTFLIFLLFFNASSMHLDDKTRISIMIKVVAFLFFYIVLEANIYNFSTAHQFPAYIPFLLIISLLLLLKLARFNKLSYN